MRDFEALSVWDELLGVVRTGYAYKAGGVQIFVHGFGGYRDTKTDEVGAIVLNRGYLEVRTYGVEFSLITESSAGTCAYCKV